MKNTLLRTVALPVLALLMGIGIAPSAKASLNCAAGAIHALNPQDQKLCAAGVERLDSVLNERYRAAMDALRSEEQKAQLRQEQRVWLQARNRCASKECFTQAYETRIEQLAAVAGTAGKPGSTATAIALADIRQVVQGSMVGFVQAPQGQTLPAVFLAPDGKADMVFLPKIQGHQDADLWLAAEKRRIFETFFGRKQFQATLVAKKVEGNFRVLGIRLPDNTEWPIRGYFSHPKPAPSDERLDITPPTPDPSPWLETFNNTCDSPGGDGIRLVWKLTPTTLEKELVIRLPWREYPCQGPREEPGSDSYWRRFMGGDIMVLGDGREGAFAHVWRRPVWPKHAGIEVTPMSDVTYLIHLDARRPYAPVEMLTPEVMLLDSALMKPFREKVKGDFDSHNAQVEFCRNVFLDRRPPKRRLTTEEIADLDKNLATCGSELESPEYSETQFIQTFVPAQWRKLWGH